MIPGTVLAAVAALQTTAPDTAQQPELPSSSSSSLLSHLLESNNPPLESEIPDIRQIISDNQARVDALNVQIDALRIAMERLLLERDEREECVRKHTAVMSPIRRVPPEVLSQIFALTLPHTRRFDDKPIHGPPWRLGHICRSWRRWALADPFLWCSLYIPTLHSSSGLGNTYTLSMFETQLLRSGNVPLAVIFNTRDCEDVVERRLWELLLPHCARWSTVRLWCATNKFNILSNLLDVVRGRVPQLKKLELLAHHNDPLGQFDSFSIAPNLCEAILTDPRYTTMSPSTHIPWGQITRYRGQYHGERQLEIVEAAFNLVECGLSFFDDLRRLPGDIVVTLHYLQRLYVDDSNFLTHLTAPVLEALYSPGTIYPFLDFVNRSSCGLTRLVLERCDSADTLVRILGLLPSLEYFLVEAWHWDSVECNNLFDAMTISGSSSDICPRLTSFIYGHRVINNILSRKQLLAIAAMAQSRLNPISPCRLSTLWLFSGSANNPLQNNATMETQMLVDQGLDIAFLSRNQGEALILEDRP